MALGDREIAEANARYLADPAAQAEARETGRMWAAWSAAERAAGPYAVVVPMATMLDVLALLEGEPMPRAFIRDAIVASVKTRTLEAQAREAADA